MFLWNARALRYYDPRTGQFVGELTVRGVIDRALTANALDARELAQQLVDGRVTLSQWRDQMARWIVALHSANVSAGVGGWGNMSGDGRLLLRERLRFHLSRLEAWVSGIQSGDAPLDGRVLARAEMYIEAGRATYEMARENLAERQGYSYERLLLGNAEHCVDCLSDAAQDWVPIGSLRPVGSRRCTVRCRCTKQFRGLKAT